MELVEVPVEYVLLDKKTGVTEQRLRCPFCMQYIPVTQESNHFDLYTPCCPILKDKRSIASIDSEDYETHVYFQKDQWGHIFKIEGTRNYKLMAWHIERVSTDAAHVIEWLTFYVNNINKELDRIRLQRLNVERML